MFLISGVRLLVNIIIANPIRVDLVLWVVLFCGVAMIITIQVKDDLYGDQ